ncbi:MAG: SDR family oxidoreductase [Leptospiraceae bacterium]|nr:SDR family oxidoreductase [Leptospiraceae bacterium]NUM40776.1 SDR family oxidoreductase [Leptospiraceae bacterium]
MKLDFWKNKTILITGASSGIGLALANELSKIPCKIFAVAKDLPVVSKGMAEIVPVQCDISSDKDLKKLQKKVFSNTENLDVLFNNAGITTHGRFDETKIEVFRKTFDINFFGTVHLTMLLLPLIKAAKGVIITTSTVSGLYGIPGRSAYSSSKSALHAVFESLRIELMEEKVRSILFCPPYTKTNLRTSGLDAKGNTLDESQHHGKIKTPEEVAQAMLQAVENPRSRLVTMDKSGNFVKWMRLFAPAKLEKILFKKLYKDFH